MNRPFLIPAPKGCDGISDGLRRLYERVTREPIPADMLALLARLK